MFKRSLVVIIILFVAVFIFSQDGFSMTRTLKKEPAIVIVAFGTTTKARVTFDYFDEQLKKDIEEEYKGYKVEWAFTSTIVRERANKKFKEAGEDRRFLSLAQVLANLEDEGYRRIAIQSLHIFPGQEYAKMVKVIDAFKTLDIDIEYGGTLLHDWKFAFEAIDALAGNFLKPDQGSNVLVAHGTPLTYFGSNSTYLGLDRYLSQKYTNVFIGGVDGILTREQALEKAKESSTKRVRLIPFMYVAGDHIMNDMMGSKPEEDGSLSWALELEAAGLKVDTLYQEYKGEKYYKGLGFYPAVNHIFIKQLNESIERLEEY